MADPSKTEQATPKRRQKARKEGSILRVADLDSTILLWGNLFMFTALGASTMALMARSMAYFLSKTSQIGYIEPANLQSLAVDILSILVKVLVPFLAANWLLALGNQLFQHGFAINLKPLQPKFSKLNPANGFKRIFSARSMVDIAKSLAKFAIIAWMAYAVVAPRMMTIMSTMYLSMSQAMGYMQETLFILYRNIMLLMLLVAGADFMFQRKTFEKGLRMTKQEVKDEARDADGNPEVKRRQKSILMASAMRRILTQVPKASVVITNPTHFAVALRYDPNTLAPILVAKGVDHLALKIRERAAVSGVVIVENPPLARAIYHNVDLDKPIPPDLYQAVAQVLAYVYHLKHAA
ncbi:MAG: flagellar biosynthesis protein FlhB [Holophaga sp.]|nr:flagellar biosynthesis protein FlhB [Holophaga sp.]